MKLKTLLHTSRLNSSSSVVVSNLHLLLMNSTGTSPDQVSSRAIDGIGFHFRDSLTMGSGVLALADKDRAGFRTQPYQRVKIAKGINMHLSMTEIWSFSSDSTFASLLDSSSSSSSDNELDIGDKSSDDEPPHTSQDESF